MALQKKTVKIIIVVAVLLNIVLFVIGFCYNNNFLELSLGGILSLDLTALVSVLLVQTLTSKRRQYDFLVKILDNIISDLLQPYLADHSSGEKTAMLQKSIANKILYVSKACPKNVSNDIEYIKEKFEQLQTYYGDHGEADPNDLFYGRLKTDIMNKIIKLQLELYGFEMRK